MLVKLTPSEMMQGAMVGVMRQVQNVKSGHGVNYFGARDENSWSLHIEGALGEMALAKHLNVYYGGTGSRGGFDVSNVDVRTTVYQNGRLILHPSDDDDRKYYLLTGHAGEYAVRGWIYGYDGKHSDYWDDPKGNRGAYFVPQERLETWAK
jgi:hypothetical protein